MSTNTGLKLSDNEVAQTTSILGVMKEFIEAVNDMDETVLIPSRLKDMKADAPTESAIVRSSSASVDISMSSLTDFEISSDEESVSSRQVSKGQNTQVLQNVTLHSYYSMLKAVKTELVRGTADDETNGNEGDDAAYNQCATAFKKHLAGLYNTLQHMTNLSKQLTSQYQQELGDHQQCIKPKTYTV
ncbi:mid1-interacting protein 1-like [Anneissia japonica]|uniref:mid1-interacting protein 1-like n=1 Tax=Anneissia japonica TaxID=1529436 RepID=UPI00142565A7|nr:mid1-interacting protein 1-like [Anneissia japonica]